MAQGYSGSYAINGTAFQVQPSSGHWLVRDLLGVDGEGHAIYPSVREFEITWGVMSATEFQQMVNAQLQVGNTGTLVFDLPKWGDAGFQFYSYSGCLVREPEFGEFFANGWLLDAKLTITNIRTN